MCGKEFSPSLKTIRNLANTGRGTALAGRFSGGRIVAYITLICRPFKALVADQADAVSNTLALSMDDCDPSATLMLARLYIEQGSADKEDQ